MASYIFPLCSSFGQSHLRAPSGGPRQLLVSLLCKPRIALVAAGLFKVLIAAAQVDTSWLRTTSDSLFEHYLNQKEYLVGGAVAVVGGDSLLFLDGHGLADRTTHRPFHPDSTIVETGSVSKLITSIAVLQLVERGRIDLELPVEHYLGKGFLKGNDTHRVLVRHLLTHTAGFDDRMAYTSSSSALEVPALEEYASGHLPPIVWEPGRFWNYSNYAFVLCAYLVQLRSGMPFEVYVRQHILIPLGMLHSGFGTNADRMPQLMRRYRLRYDDNDSLYSQDAGVLHTNILGADGFRTTAGDMSHFLRMLLDSGSYLGTRIITAASLQASLQDQFSYSPRLPEAQGLCWRIVHGGADVYAYQEGDERGVQSGIMLFPRSRLAAFVAFNNPVGANWRSDFRDRLMRRIGFVPAMLDEDTLADYAIDLDGTYIYMNDGQSTFEKLGTLGGSGVMHVQRSRSGFLDIDGVAYHCIAPLLYRSDSTSEHVLFLSANENSGDVRYLTLGFATYRRAHAWESPTLHQFILLVGLAIILVLLVLPIFRLLFGSRSVVAPALRRARLWSSVCAAFLIAFLITFFIASRTVELDMGIPPVIRLAFTWSLLAAMVYPAVLFYTIRTWRTHGAGIWPRVWHTVAATSLFAVLSVLCFYKALGFHLG